MFLQKIQINNFRNIENCFLEFNTGINYFVADNTQGKTSLIEALYFLAHNKSFKTKNNKNIVFNNKELFSIQAIILNKNNLKKIIVTRNLKNQQNDIFINNKKILNSSILSKQIPVQIISADKGFLVGGENKNKRYYLDWGMFHVEQDFLELHKKSKKIQKNINSLILNKEIKQLDAWFKEFAKINNTLNTLKNNYLQQLQKIMDTNFFDNLILNVASFKYKFNNGLPSGVNNEDDIYNFLIKNKEKIIKDKYLKYGSHLASIDFYFDDKQENQLSRGQQKTLSIIFWLTQIVHLKNNNIESIILIDDLSSELDKHKIKIILGFLKKIATQTFITSINPISNNFYTIKNGQISV